MCPSSGETTVFIRHLAIVILCGILSGIQEHMLLHIRQSSTQNNKYQVSHKHSCFSWWWAHSRLKHVEIDKYTKNTLCTKLTSFTRYTEMHGQQNVQNATQVTITPKAFVTAFWIIKFTASWVVSSNCFLLYYHLLYYHVSTMHLLPLHACYIFPILLISTFYFTEWGQEICETVCGTSVICFGTKMCLLNSICFYWFLEFCGDFVI